MKKFFIALLAAIMMICVLTACTPKPTETDTELPTDAETVEETVEETMEETAEETTEETNIGGLPSPELGTTVDA